MYCTRRLADPWQQPIRPGARRVSEPMSDAETIYADYQATTPVDPRVVEAMAPYWNGSFGNPHSDDHVEGWRAAESVRRAASSVAALIGGDPDEVVFTSGATEANNLALLGLGRRAPPGPPTDPGQRDRAQVRTCRSPRPSRSERNSRSRRSRWTQPASCASIYSRACSTTRCSSPQSWP